MLDVGLGHLLISVRATIRAVVQLAAGCNASILETVFDMHNAELNETMGQAQSKHFLPVTSYAQ